MRQVPIAHLLPLYAAVIAVEQMTKDLGAKEGDSEAVTYEMAAKLDAAADNIRGYLGHLSLARGTGVNLELRKAYLHEPLTGRDPSVATKVNMPSRVCTCKQLAYGLLVEIGCPLHHPRPSGSGTRGTW